VIEQIEEACAAGARRDKACEVLGLTLRSVQRWQEESSLREDGRKAAAQRRTPANAFTPNERAQVLEVVNRPEFTDQSPKQIVPHLADQGEYIASESTIYRILRAEQQLAHRGKARPATHQRPEPLVAASPNQVWTWDITYLPSTVRGVFFYLYMIMDLYSRKIVGWEVHDQESPDHAATLIRQSYMREEVNGSTLILHSDNGSPMKGGTMLAMLQRLGVIPSFSRPSVSNDNAFSEALFRTLKYTPAYPEGPFLDIDKARTWVARFVPWFNEEHLHSSIQFVTPGQRHRGEDHELLLQRVAVYEAARASHPERWSGNLRNWEPVGPVSLNPGKSTTKKEKKSNKQT
jgi:transposase InsO family protein